MMRKMLVAVMVLGVIPAVMAWGADWPQFRGPDRDGKSPETGLLKSWPTEGPKLLWKVPGCGTGYSSPSIVGDTVYTAGDVGGQSSLVAFSTDGKPKGRFAFAAGGPGGEQAGMRSTPTVEGGSVYLLNPSGELFCAAANNLAKRWQVNILKTFKGRKGQWDLAESVLIDGNNVICTPGGPDATIVALDKRSGRTVWTSKGLSDEAAYASPIKITVGKIPMIVTMTGKGLVGVSATMGQFLWRYDRPANGTANCPSAVASGSRVFEATGYGTGGGAVDITVSGTKVTAQQAWETREMVCHHGGYVVVNDYVYGNHGGGYACLDFKTGQKKWSGAGVGKGSVIYADGMLYCLGEGGSVGLVEAKPDGFNQVSQFRLPPDGKGQAWAHLAIANGRLYIRHGDMLYCYDLKGQAAAGEKPAEKPAEKPVQKPVEKKAE